MAHEIAHITARHAAQRAELERPPRCSPASPPRCSTSRRRGEEVGARMKLSIAHFSRQQEFEADKIGIKVIAKAGYDPYAASRFLDRARRAGARCARR